MKKRLMKKRIGPILLAIALSLGSCVLAACLVSERHGETDEAMIAWINDPERTNAAYASSMIGSLQESRIEERARESASIEESLYESSVQESILESSIEESLSIAESIYESSVQESSLEEYYRESYAAVLEEARDLSRGGAGGPIGRPEAGRIVHLSDDAIPKLRELFADTVILGNNQARGILDSGILGEDTVLYRWAARVDTIADMVNQAASLGRKKALFIMGVTDIGYYQGNSEAWKQEYLKRIAEFRSKNPQAEIYLEEIIPISAEFSYRWHNYYRIPKYNEVLEEVAEEAGATIVRVADFAFPGFLCDDTGVMYSREFHFYWAETVADQMGLWEE